MATIQIYSQEANTNYTVTLNVYSTVTEGTADGVGEYYLRISTNYTHQGTSFPVFVVKDLSDVPLSGGSAPAADFTALIQQYLDYFINRNIMESSSSSSSEAYSSSSSSESSSTSSLSSESTSSTLSSSSSSFSSSSTSST